MHPAEGLMNEYEGGDGWVADAGIEAHVTVVFFGDDIGVVVLDMVSVIMVVVLVQVLVVDSVTCAVWF